MIFKIIIQAALFCLLLIGSKSIADSSIKEQPQKPQIYVSVPPLAFFAEQIAGDNFEIVTVIGPGQSPTTFETTPKQFAKFANAKIFFTAGVPFEKQLNKKLKSSFENLYIIDTQRGIDLQKIEHHHHGDSNEDHNDGINSLDPHTWLDPALSKMMAQNIYDGLVKFYPADSLMFQDNLNLILDELDKLDFYIRQELEPFAGKSFYTFHPAFGYFAKAYNLKQMSIEFEGKEPSARQLIGIIEKVRKERVKIIFTQPQFSDKSARAIAESIGAAVIPIDPLSKDYLNNLKEITNQLVLAFAGIESKK